MRYKLYSRCTNLAILKQSQKRFQRRVPTRVIYHFYITIYFRMNRFDLYGCMFYLFWYICGSRKGLKVI